MGINTILIIAAFSLLLQVVLLVYIRKMKKKIKQPYSDPVLEKYSIRTAGDAWRYLNNSEVSFEEKEVIEKFYKKFVGN